MCVKSNHCNVVSQENQVNRQEAIQGEPVKSNKVLILSDEFDRNINAVLSNIIHMSNFRIESVIKPGASFKK